MVYHKSLLAVSPRPCYCPCALFVSQSQSYYSLNQTAAEADKHRQPFAKELVFHRSFSAAARNGKTTRKSFFQSQIVYDAKTFSCFKKETKNKKKRHSSFGDVY